MFPKRQVFLWPAPIATLAALCAFALGQTGCIGEVGPVADPEAPIIRAELSAEDVQELTVKYAKEEHAALFSLSVRGDFSHPKYTAVWSKQGPLGAVKPILGIHPSELPALLSREAAEGFQLQTFSAAGPASNAVVAGVLIKKIKSAASSRPSSPSSPMILKHEAHSLREFQALTTQSLEIESPADVSVDLISDWAWPFKDGTIQKAMDSAVSAGKIPFAFSIYGTDADTRYAVALEANPEHVAWSWGQIFDTLDDLKRRTSADAIQWARPALVSLSGFGRYAAVFVDTQIDGGVTQDYDLSYDELQSQAAQRWEQGYKLLQLASGSNAHGNPTWSVLWGKNEVAMPRQMSTHGLGVPELAAVDAFVLDAMSSSGTRGATLAIAKNGRLIYAKGYTFAESGYPTLTPETLFRIASLSKPITSIAIHQAIQAGKLSLDDTLASILDYRDPNGNAPSDPRALEQKVWHMLSHTTGWDRGIVSDLPNPWDVINAFHKDFPMKSEEWRRTKLSQNMEFMPGERIAYSNMGYLTLGRVLEKKFPELGSYENIVREHVLKPLGISRPRISPSRLAVLDPQIARMHDPGLTVSTTTADASRDWVPLPYGGEDYSTFDSFGGWLFSTVDYVKVLTEFSRPLNRILDPEHVNMMWEAPIAGQPDVRRGWWAARFGTVTALTHGGSVPGISTVMGHRDDGYSVALFFNRGGADCWTPFVRVNDLLNTTPVFTDADYFSNYGL